MKTKVAGVLLVCCIAAGYYAWQKPVHTIPGDLRDAVADNAIVALEAGAGEKDVTVPEPEIKPVYVETSSRKGLGNKGYVAANDTSVTTPIKPVEFVPIPGGKFTMGTDDLDSWFNDARLVHEVSIKAFEISKTAVTVEQYAECVIKGGCTEPGADDYCNWGKINRGSYPVNCVDWNQAQAYARFKGARLPSEAEWEYAATSGGRNQKYPWGNDAPSNELAVFNTEITRPVCSKPKGNTAQGLCDMAGNVWQWVQDTYQDSYKGAPLDGSAVEGTGSGRVIRGGSFNDFDARNLRADNRFNLVSGLRHGSVGFRLARSH